MYTLSNILSNILVEKEKKGKKPRGRARVDTCQIFRRKTSTPMVLGCRCLDPMLAGSSTCTQIYKYMYVR